MDKQDKILKALKLMAESIDLLKSTMDVDDKHAKQKVVSETPNPLAKSTNIGPAPNYRDPEWPAAVDPNLIVTNSSDTEKQYRAVQIIDSLEISFNNSSVLDFGCGEGHIAYEMAQTADKVVGYDIQRSNVWDDKIKDNLYFITDESAVKHHAPYDYIILFDVLDHVKNKNQLEILKNINKWLSKDGHVFVRAHPWTSKHGGHLYEDINKAYVHLLLTPGELPRNVKLEHVEKITKPLATYEGWFKKSGLIVDSKSPQNESVDDYFDDKLINRIINLNWDHDVDVGVVRKIMSIQAIDYVLSRSK